MSAGNIPIFEEDEGEELGNTGKELKERLVKNEAKIAFHFFQEDLQKIAQDSTLVKKPKRGEEVEELLITFGENRALSARRDIDKLKVKVRQLPQTPVDLPKDKKDSISKTQAEFEDVLLLHDADLDSVMIAGRSQENVDRAAHKLKVNAGLINPTNRQNRKVVDDSSDEFKSIRASNSSLTNINKYKKPDITGGFSASRSVSDYTSGGTKAGSKRSYSRQSSSEKINFKIALKNGFVLKVYNESITKLDVDVIVNAANDTMMHGGGVARVISEAAGWELDKQSREFVDKNGPLPVTKNIVTTAGNLRQYSAVIHAVGPEWYKYKDKVRCLDDLFDCIYDILATCKEKKFRTVGMSAISAGIFGVPKELCANMYVYAAAKFSGSLSASECPRELHVVDIDTSILKLVEESSKRWEKNPESLNPRLCVPDFLEKNPDVSVQSTGYRPGRRYGHRNEGHGATGWKEGKEDDGDDATSGGNNGRSVDPVYLAGRGHETGRRRESGQRSRSGQTVKLKCSIKKLQGENYYWGATASLFSLNKTVTVKIYEGSIDRLKNMDAIVCGTDRNLQQSGYIAEALSKKGGKQYIEGCKEMCRKHADTVSPGDVFKCKAGGLGAKFVLHVVCKRILYANDEETDDYRTCIVNVLKKANKNDLKKIALPLVATGKIQTNTDSLKKCGAALLKALDVYLENKGTGNVIKEVHLVNNKQSVSTVLLEVFDEASSGEKRERSKSPGFKGGERAPAVRGRGQGGRGRGNVYKRDDRSPVEPGSDKFKRSKHSGEIPSKYEADMSDDDIEHDEDTRLNDKNNGASESSGSAQDDHTTGSGGDTPTPQKPAGNLMIIEN